MGVETNGRRPTMSKEDQKLVCMLYPDISVAQIAEKMEVSQKMIREVLYRNGIPLNKDRDDVLSIDAIKHAMRKNEIQEHKFISYHGCLQYVIMPIEEYQTLTKE